MRRRVAPLLAPVLPLLAMLALITGVALLLAAGSASLRSSVTAALIELVIVVGLYMFVGNCGIVSFGHVSFMAIGAYVSAIVTIPATAKGLLLPELPSALQQVELGTAASVAIAALVCAVVALAAAAPLMRLDGIASAIATLSLLVIVQVVLSNWNAVSSGSGTLTGIPLDTGIGTALLAALAACVAAFAVQSSRLGLRLRAAREDEPAARSLGIHVERDRRAAFVLSAAVVGGGGAVYAHFLGSIAPSDFYLQMTFLTLAMLVAGGTRSLWGAVVGTALVSALSEAISRLEDGSGLGPLQLQVPVGTREIAIAVIILALLVLRPEGVTRGRELRLPTLRARRALRRGAEEPGPVEL